MSFESRNHSAVIGLPASTGEQSRGSAWRAMYNGARCHCPRCGTGKLFTSYLKVAGDCPSCDLELHHHRADDAPPYFTMFIVGHLLVPLLFFVEVAYQPQWWVHTLLWVPLAIMLTLWLLPITKGAIIGLQWNFGMHGFEDARSNDADKTYLAGVASQDRL